MSFKSEYILKGLSFISALFFCGIFLGPGFLGMKTGNLSVTDPREKAV